MEQEQPSEKPRLFVQTGILVGGEGEELKREGQRGCKPVPAGGKVNMQWSKHQKGSKILRVVQKFTICIVQTLSNFV